MNVTLRRTRLAVALGCVLALALLASGCAGKDGSQARESSGTSTVTDDGRGGDTSGTTTVANPDTPVSSDDGSGGDTSGAGDGDDSPPDTGQPSAGGKPVEAKLTIVVKEGEPPTTRTVKVTCPDPRGANAGACITLAQYGDLLLPLSRDVVCTEQYGGPETAHMTGTANGQKVDVTFRRTNGCEIDRWNRAQPIWEVVRAD